MTRHAFPLTEYILHLTDHRLRITDYLSPISSHFLATPMRPINHYRITFTYDRMPVTHHHLLHYRWYNQLCLRHLTIYLLTLTYELLPISVTFSPITESRLTITCYHCVLPYQLHNTSSAISHFLLPITDYPYVTTSYILHITDLFSLLSYPHAAH